MQHTRTSFTGNLFASRSQIRAPAYMNALGVQCKHRSAIFAAHQYSCMVVVGHVSKAIMYQERPGLRQTSAVVKRFYAALAAGEEYADDAWARFMAQHRGGDGDGSNGAARRDDGGDADAQPGASPGNMCYKCAACSGLRFMFQTQT